MLSEMWCYRGSDKSGDADPAQDEVGMHADVGCHFAVPVARCLELIEPKLKGVFVVGPAWEVSMTRVRYTYYKKIFTLRSGLG